MDKMLDLWTRHTPTLSLFQDFFSSIDNDQISEIETTPEYHLLTVVAPGLNKEDFNISLNNNILSVAYDVQNKNSKYIKQKKYKQSWTLPSTAKSDQIEAIYEQGILKLKIPRSVGKENNIKTITVK